MNFDESVKQACHTLVKSLVADSDAHVLEVDGVIGSSKWLVVVIVGDTAVDAMHLILDTAKEEGLIARKDEWPKVM